jgi:hypothetical protein
MKLLEKIKWHLNFIKEDRLAKILLIVPTICGLLVIAMVINLAVDVVHYMKKPHHLTYQEICAPNHFVQRFYYYHDKAYAICGSETTEPVIIQLR